MTTEEKIKKIQLFRPIDDTFFEVLAQNKDVCQEMLRVILQDNKLVVEQVVPQAHIRNLYGRSVCLDALCIMSNGARCNVEVQRANNDNHLRRVRFNSSIITAMGSETGMKYMDVIDLCVVYISEKDFLKGGKTIYHVDKVVRETGKVVDDGLKEIFVNAEVNDNTDVAELMECFKQQHVSHPKFPALSAEVKRLKETEGGLGAMCKVMQDIVDVEVAEAKRKAIHDLIELGVAKDKILALGYEEELYDAVEAELLQMA